MKRLCCRAALLMSVLACAAHAVEAQGVKAREELPNLHKVNETLWRGGQPTARGMERLASLGIRTVVNLRDDDENADAEALAAHTAGLRYFNIPLTPFGRPDDQSVERVLSIIEAPDNQPVFVHCKRGSDRTGTIIAVYRIRREGWTAEEALREAESHGLHWLLFEMKDYIADAYHRQLHTAGTLHPPLKDSKTQLAGTAATSTRLALEKSLNYSRRGLKRLLKTLP